MSARKALRGDDSGQLMLLAGIVVTLAFLLTALTLSQVTSLERQAAADKPNPISTEWRFLHERIATNLESAVPPDLKVDNFKTLTFPVIASTFRSLEAEKGYDAVLRLADDATRFNFTEYNLTYLNTLDGKRYYDAWSVDGKFRFTGVYDGVSDGVIKYDACPDTDYVGSCIAGVVVFVHLSDPTSTMSEVILFSVNRPPPS